MAISFKGAHFPQDIIPDFSVSLSGVPTMERNRRRAMKVFEL